MKKSSNLLSFCMISVFALISYTSCNQIHDEIPESKTISHHRVTPKRISKDIKELTKSDAGIVAKLFQSKRNTRADYSEVVSVVPITDENGEIKIYAVNFLDGYILVSATKDYFPILAYIDHGTYSNKNKIDGEEFIIGEMIEKIKYIAPQATDKKKEHIAHEWSKFEELDTPLLTRAGINDFDDEAYEEALTGLEELWWDECRGRIYKLTEIQDHFTEQEYNSYCCRAEAEFDDLFGGTKFGWRYTAMIGIWEGLEHQSGINLMKTQWDQYFDESSSATLLGCVTVAVGQLMKFFEYPSYFNWSQMNNTTSCTETSIFLRTLKKELNVDNENAASIYDAQRVLRNYGYQCTVASHNSASVLKSLRNRRPVFQRGQKNGQQYGHAWICDGYSYTQHYDEYKLFGLGYHPYDTNKYCYREFEGDNKIVWYDYGTYYYHMNWGLGFKDGWYLDDMSDAPVAYSNGRMDIIIEGMN